MLLTPSVSMGQISTLYGGTGMDSWPITRIPFGSNSFGMFNATTSSLFTYATSTSKLNTPNIDISGTASTSILCLTSDSCRSTWPTGGSSFAYPFPSNSTTTQLSLLGGVIFGGSGNAYIAYNNPGFAFNTPDSFTWGTAASPTMTLDSTNGLYLPNAQYYRSQNSGGNFHDLLGIDNSNIVHVGSPSLATSIEGTALTVSSLTDGTLYANGVGDISAQTGTSGNCVQWGVNGALADAGAACGTGSGGNSKWATSTADSTAIVPAGATKVGIGTSTPYGTLAVSTAAQQSGLTPLLNVASTTNFSLFNVLGNGNVGIGTSSPYAKLSVHGVAGATSPDLFSVASTTSSNATTTALRIDSSGQMYIGQTGTYGGYIQFPSYSGSAFFGRIGHFNDANDGPSVGVQSTNIDVRFVSGARSFWVASGGARDTGIAMSTTNAFTSAAAKMLYVKNNSQSSSGEATGVYVEGIWNTSSGTANDSDILIDRTETSLYSSGAHSFIKGRVASVNKFIINNLGGAWFNDKVGIGTTTPYAKLAVQGSSQSATLPLLSVATSTNASVFSVNGGGHIVTGGSTPTVSSCGTGPSVSGNDTAGTVTVGSGVVTACTITFAAPRANTPRVVGVVTGGGVNIAGGYSSKSTTAVTFSFATTIGGGTFDYYIVE